MDDTPGRVKSNSGMEYPLFLAKGRTKPPRQQSTWRPTSYLVKKRKGEKKKTNKRKGERKERREEGEKRKGERRKRQGNKRKKRRGEEKM